jgi:hypothetical protein
VPSSKSSSSSLSHAWHGGRLASGTPPSAIRARRRSSCADEHRPGLPLRATSATTRADARNVQTELHAMSQRWRDGKRATAACWLEFRYVVALRVAALERRRILQSSSGSQSRVGPSHNAREYPLGETVFVRGNLAPFHHYSGAG